MSQERYTVNKDFMLRKIAGEAVLIPIGEGCKQLNGMITVNETFEFIWTQFQTPKTIDEVIQLAKAEYNDESQQIEHDIHKFVTESLHYGFMKGEK